MRIVARKTIKEFWEIPEYRDAQSHLESWYAEACNANWKNPAEVKRQFGNGSVIKGSRFVFNIAGNKYRLVVKIHYNTGIIYIRFIGTHAQYDEIDVERI